MSVLVLVVLVVYLVGWVVTVAVALVDYVTGEHFRLLWEPGWRGDIARDFEAWLR